MKHQKRRRLTLQNKHSELFNSPARADGNGEITVAVDWDVWQWLGWKDYPNKNPTAAAQYKILEENIQKELKIATRNIKPKRMENKNEIKSKVEFRQEIKQLQTMIDEIESMTQTLLEMNRNQQPTENARIWCE